MKNIRKNSVTGIVELNSFGEKDVSLQFTEWWNGEGVDFTFSERKKLSLHLNEIHALFVGMMAAEMVDLKQVMHDVEELKQETAEREETIRNTIKHLKQL
jgi:hypothetical protein